MKKLWCVIILAAFLLSLCSCTEKSPDNSSQDNAVTTDQTVTTGSTAKNNTTKGPTVPIKTTTDTHSDFSGKIKLMQYAWSGWGIKSKLIENEAAESLLKKLDAMTETKETVDKLSDDIMKEGTAPHLSAERGTMWIETADKIYRITPDRSKIYLVERHFGKGTRLEITEEFEKELNDAWHYWPYDYWLGTYENKKFSISHVYPAESDITVTVKNIYVEKKYDPQNKITVELCSLRNQTVRAFAKCYLSDDNLARSDFKDIHLKANTPQTVELSFGGWEDTRYWVTTGSGNTMITITINP